MNHKGYIGLVTYDEEAGILHGEVINTHDVITFQATCAEDIKQAFIDSVEDYLAFCAERGEKPERPFRGNLGLRMKPELHQQAYIRSKQEGISLNEWINRAIEKQLREF
jgi:predicted HicB family RNase H-like nuclease